MDFLSFDSRRLQSRSIGAYMPIKSGFILGTGDKYEDRIRIARL